MSDERNWTAAATESFRALERERDELAKALTRAGQKLEDEKSLFEREQRHREALLAASKECLAGNEADLSYLRFKADMRKCDENIHVGQDAITVLEIEILPPLKNKFEAAQVALQRGILDFCLAQKQDYRQQMESHLAVCMDIYDEWRRNYQQLFANYGLPVFSPDHQLRVRVWEKRMHKFLEEKGMISHHEFSALDQRRKQHYYDEQQAKKLAPAPKESIAKETTDGTISDSENR